jgi:hypothetical protein
MVRPRHVYLLELGFDSRVLFRHVNLYLLPVKTTGPISPNLGFGQLTIPFNTW